MLLYCVCSGACVCVWIPEVCTAHGDLRIMSSVCCTRFSPNFFRQGLSLNLEFGDSSKLVNY